VGLRERIREELKMRKTLALVACGGVLVAGGVFAGTVIGDDGSTELTERLQHGGFDQATADVENAGSLERSAIASAGKKVQVLKGSSSSRTVSGGGVDSVTLRCPNKFSALSAGFETSDPGVVPGVLAPALKNNGEIDTRGIFVGVLSLATTDIDWRAWATCAKGVKDNS